MTTLSRQQLDNLLQALPVDEPFMPVILTALDYLDRAESAENAFLNAQKLLAVVLFTTGTVKVSPATMRTMPREFEIKVADGVLGEKYVNASPIFPKGGSKWTS
jgi:hypothetical protein